MIVLGIMGDARVAHSLSPRMHNALLAKHGLEGVYLPFAVEPAAVGQAVAGIKALGLAGVNVTVPHKQAVVPHLDRLSEDAAALGAVNTIKPEGGRLIGYNTDLEGFRRALAQAGAGPAGGRALVLGAGGAARAVVLALVRDGAQVMVAARRREQAAALCAELGGEGLSLDQAAKVFKGVDLVVNATSVSSPAESPDMRDWLGELPPAPNLSLVMDLNYGRQDNFWAGLAQRNGAAFGDGLAMLAHQACLSFNLWTGLEARVEDFLAALEARS